MNSPDGSEYKVLPCVYLTIVCEQSHSKSFPVDANQKMLEATYQYSHPTILNIVGLKKGWGNWCVIV